MFASSVRAPTFRQHILRAEVVELTPGEQNRVSEGKKFAVFVKEDLPSVLKQQREARICKPLKCPPGELLAKLMVVPWRMPCEAEACCIVRRWLFGKEPPDLRRSDPLKATIEENGR